MKSKSCGKIEKKIKTHDICMAGKILLYISHQIIQYHFFFSASISKENYSIVFAFPLRNHSLQVSLSSSTVFSLFLLLLLFISSRYYWIVLPHPQLLWSLYYSSIFLNFLDLFFFYFYYFFSLLFSGSDILVNSPPQVLKCSAHQWSAGWGFRFVDLLTYP